MKKYILPALFLGLFAPVLLGVSAALRADNVVFVNEEDGKNQSLLGTVKETARDGVVIGDKKKAGQKINANLIVSVSYEDEPEALTVARKALDSSQFKDALAQLGTIKNEEKLPDMIRQETAFFKVFAKAQLTLSGDPEFEPLSVAKELNQFTEEFPDSYHFYEAARLMIQLLTACDRVSDARDVCQQLADAPWPETKYEGKVTLGNIDLAEGQTEEAEKLFDEVIAAEESSAAIEKQKSYAKIGKALITAKGGDYDAAKKLFAQIQDESDSADAKLQATLYNAMGDAACGAGNNKEAILAFLHTDLLFSSARAEHIKALKNLVALWRSELREDRAQEAASILRGQYGLNP